MFRQNLGEGGRKSGNRNRCKDRPLAQLTGPLYGLKLLFFRRNLGADSGVFCKGNEASTVIPVEYIVAAVFGVPYFGILGANFVVQLIHARR